MSEVTVLNHNSDFRRIYSKGSSYANPALVIYLMKNRAGICRIGITSSKKIGNAVERNKSRRLVRAAFSQVYKTYSDKLTGYDIVFVCRVKTRYRKSTELEKVITSLLTEAKLI